MFKIIEINSGNIVEIYQTYSECIDWLDSYGDIINYTIISE